MYSYAKTLNDAGMSWSKPSSDLIEKAWATVKQSSINNEVDSIPADVSSLKPEDGKVHPAFLKLVKTISSILPHNPRNFLLRHRIFHPLYVPDIVITRFGISSCSWFDAYCCIELKTTDSKISDAVVQCWDYCYASHKCMKVDVLSNSRLGIASNLNSITVMHIPHELLETQISPNFSLFPPDWIDSVSPTKGFELLCHALVLPIPSERHIRVFFVKTSSTVPLIVNKTLYQNDDCVVSKVNISGKDFVVKEAVGKYSKGIIASFELRNYKEISRISGFESYMVPLRPEFEVPHGFVMEYVGEIIETWIEIRGFASDDARDAALKPVLLHLFRGLKLLHSNDWYHMDVRPGNIVVADKAVVNGTVEDGTVADGAAARLIDWATAIQTPRLVQDGSRLFMQGQEDPFWPDEPLDKMLMYPGKWDLVGFGLVICYLTSSRIERADIFTDLSTRSKTIQKRAAESPSQLFTIGARIYKHGSDLGVPIDYDLIEKWLIS